MSAVGFAPEYRPMFTLTIYPNDGTPFIVDLPLKRLTLGRGVENHIVISSDYISARHACLEWFPEKKAWGIRDLGSRHGTRLNGNLIRKAPLKDGDILQFSAALIACFKETKPEAGPPPDMVPAKVRKTPVSNGVAMENADAILRQRQSELNALDAGIAHRQETLAALELTLTALWEEEKERLHLQARREKQLKDLDCLIASRASAHAHENAVGQGEPGLAATLAEVPLPELPLEARPEKRQPHGAGVDWVEAEMVRLGFEFHSMEVPRKLKTGDA